MLTDKDQKRAAIEDRLLNTLDVVDTSGSKLPPPYRGKVRDVFDLGQELLLVASDRVSAFDVVLGTIPLKGALLTEQSAFWLEKVSAIVPTHFIERVDAQAMRVQKAEPLPVELVVRGSLAGSLLREPAQTRGAAYGLKLPPDLAPYQRFEAPIVTPTTKESEGHDRPCSLDDLVASGRCTQAQCDACVEMALQLFDLGAAFADQNGLILVDTKYEFGVVDGEVILIDEVHTADSSRFWDGATYADRIAAGEAPVMLDKERLRTWLLANGFSGDGTPPSLPDAVRVDLASHYWELTERLLGRPFAPPKLPPATRLSAFFQGL